MKKIYLSPKISIDHIKYPNSYISNLETSLSNHFEIINKTNNKKGVLELFRYLVKTDIFYFNWIENTYQKKFGKLQTILLFSHLFIAKLLRKKILWTLHNKYSHDKTKTAWAGFTYRILVKSSNLILTHSQAGADLIKATHPNCAFKIKYIIHPILDIFPKISNKEIKYDFLIWGQIQPYKGVLEFLEFTRQSENMKNFKILILGRCLDDAYKIKLNSCLSDNIVYYDQFFELEEISRFANQSKFILFTYKPESILSSGSLMDSIRMRSFVIGPNDGAFKDMSLYYFTYVYNNFNDVIEIHKKYESNADRLNNEIEEFCKDNTWEKFGEKLNIELSKIVL